MPLHDALVPGINVALNESEVLGLRLAKDQAAIEVLLHVLALPPSGPIDQDARRILVLGHPSRVRVLLRTTRSSELGPPIPLPDLAALDDFFDSLTWLHPMYGWEFVDGGGQEIAAWPKEVSLDFELSGGRPDHSLFWFADCGRIAGGANEAFEVEGEVLFSELTVRRANEEQEPIDSFISDARRWWDALHDGDERLTVERQRDAGTGPRWRNWQAAQSQQSD